MRRTQSEHNESGFLLMLLQKSFGSGVQNSVSRRRGLRVKMRGTSSPHAKLTGEFTATEAIRIDGCFSLRVFAKIRRPATSDFCNKIGTFRKFRDVRYLVAIGGRSQAVDATLYLRPKGWSGRRWSRDMLEVSMRWRKRSCGSAGGVGSRS